MRDTIEMAREAGMVYREFEDEFANANTDGVDLKTLKRFEELVRADERNRIGQSCYCPNCEALGKELSALKAHPAPVPDLTHDQWDEWQDKHGVILKREALDELRSMLYTTPPAQPTPMQPDWKSEYQKSVELHCITLDELREADSWIKNLEKLMADQDAMLKRQTARIVDLQEHIDNFDGEDR